MNRGITQLTVLISTTGFAIFAIGLAIYIGTKQFYETTHDSIEARIDEQTNDIIDQALESKPRK